MKYLFTIIAVLFHIFIPHLLQAQSAENKYCLTTMPIFSTAENFSDGLAAVSIDKKYGYIDKTGKEVIPFQYEHAKSFIEGLAAVQKDKKYGYIDKTGKEIIACKYAFAGSYNEDLACVQLGKQYGYIDKTGKEITPIKYDNLASFRGGLAAVQVAGKYGYIDKTGKEVIPFKYDDVGYFNEGLASVQIDNKYGYIDKTGKEVVACKYDFLSTYSEGLAAARIGQKYGYIDKNGNEVIPVKLNVSASFEGIISKYSNFPYFQDGLAISIVDGKYGYINKSGTEQITPKYLSATPFKDGFAYAQVDKEVWALIDKTGKELKTYNYPKVSGFTEKTALVSTSNTQKSSLFGLIDQTGKEVIPTKYEEISSFTGDLIPVKLNGKWGYIDKNGKEVFGWKKVEVNLEFDTVFNKANIDNKLIIILQSWDGMGKAIEKKFTHPVFNEYVTKKFHYIVFNPMKAFEPIKIGERLFCFNLFYRLNELTVALSNTNAGVSPVLFILNKDKKVNLVRPGLLQNDYLLKTLTYYGEGFDKSMTFEEYEKTKYNELFKSEKEQLTNQK